MIMKGKGWRSPMMAACLAFVAALAVLVFAYSAGMVDTTGARAAAPGGIPGGAARDAAGPPKVPRSVSLVVSQVYGGGGNTGAPWHNDFIEVFNPTGAGVSVTGWSVQYASATGTTWQVTALN